MVITCISASGRDLPQELIRPDLGIEAERQFSLVEGKQYVVYGLTVFLGHVWFYVCDEDYTYYPIWNPAPLFEVTDGRLSAHWVLGFLRVAEERVPVMAFKEWVEEPCYYDRLTDGDPSAVDVFRRYKARIDEESATPDTRGRS